MALSRRKFIQRSGAAFAASGLSTGLTQRVWASTSLSIGTATLETLSDGHLVLPGSFYFGDLPKEDIAPVLARYNVSYDQVEPDCNVTLLRDGDRTVLFDVGSGPEFMPSAGKLGEALDAVGLSPGDVTHVVMTHGHPDHIWGLVDDFGDPLFADAQHMMGKTEWDYWTDEDTVNQMEGARVAFAVGAKRRLDVFADIIEVFGDDEEILPGIASRATFGHTPGHMSFEVRQGNDAVMVVGDAIGNHFLSFEQPGWFAQSDQDQETGAATRLALMDQLATEKTAMVGFHLPNGGVGRVERKDSAYIFSTEV